MFENYKSKKSHEIGEHRDDCLTSRVESLECRSNAAEVASHKDWYRPDYFVTLTARNKRSEELIIQHVNHLFNQICRKRFDGGSQGLGRHLFWYGWGGLQPNRASNGEDVMHYHLFVEFDGGVPVWFKDELEKRYLARKKRKSDKSRIRRIELDLVDAGILGLDQVGIKADNRLPGTVMHRNWDGDCLVLPYDGRIEAIAYSRMKHPQYIWGTGCPRIRNQCNKDGRTCLYERDISLFMSRHR